MKIDVRDPPREFVVAHAGHPGEIRIKDCAHIALNADEQVTFTTPAGGEYDVSRKSWGFYAAPSTNARLPRFGLRACLAKSAENKFFVFLVERGQEDEFQRYLDTWRNEVVAWLDTDEACARVDRALATMK